MVLTFPILLKIGSTLYRFARYYYGDERYRRKGPPPVVLRLIGPFVVVLTLVVMASGIALLFVSASQRSTVLLVHKASFVLWFGATTIHVLGHIFDTASLAPRDWYGQSRREVDGAGARQWLLAVSLLLGILAAVLVWGRSTRYFEGGPPQRADIVMKSRPHDGSKKVDGPWIVSGTRREPFAGVASPSGADGL